MIEFYESYFSLSISKPDLNSQQYDWLRYNPRKEINRWGASLTSLDGLTTGIPDLDSLYEFNQLNNTNYQETDFKTKTKYFKPFQHLDDYFSLGRSHILKLGMGGFFPYHRDFDESCFRLIYTISGCDETNMAWIQNNQLLKLHNECWYYINTKMIHSVFSFFGSQFAVFNVVDNVQARNSLVKLMSIK